MSKHYVLKLSDDRELTYEGLDGYQTMLKRVSLLIKRGQEFSVKDSDGKDITSSVTKWKAEKSKEGIAIRDCAFRIIQTIPASTLPAGYNKSSFDAEAYVREHHQYFLKKHKLS